MSKVTMCGGCGKAMRDGVCQKCDKRKDLAPILPDEPKEPTGWESALDASLREFNYGDIIPHEWLLRHFGVQLEPDMPANEYNKQRMRIMHAFQLFREVSLTKHKRDLKNIRGEGYLIVDPSQQVAEAMADFSDAFTTELVRVRRRIENAKLDALSQRQLRERDEAMGRLAAIEAFAGPKLPAPRIQVGELSSTTEQT